LTYYAHHIDAIQDIPWDKLCDESHFVGDISNRRGKYWELSTRDHLSLVKAIYTEKITALPSYKDLRQFICDIRTRVANTQWDFAKFVCNAIAQDWLEPGDFLLMDNATAHCGTETFEELLGSSLEQ